MKKMIILILTAAMLLLSGCQKTSDLIRPHEEEEPVPVPVTEETENNEENAEPVTKIVLSQTLNMTNDWTIMGDYNMALTKSGKKDRIILATSAQSVNGEMQWDDSQYWTLAVVTDNGAYNLFYERFQGFAFFEINEAYLQGIATPVITIYAFSGVDREIRNYIYSYDEDAFIEKQIFTTKVFSTGGINNIYSNFPEYKAR